MRKRDGEEVVLSPLEGPEIHATHSGEVTLRARQSDAECQDPRKGSVWGGHGVGDGSGSRETNQDCVAVQAGHDQRQEGAREN